MNTPASTRPTLPWLGAAVALCVAWGLGCSDAGASYDTDGEPVPNSVVREIYEGATVKEVDLLIVIDDSSSMAGEAANWAANLGVIVAVLQDPSVRADSRVGIVRTSGANCGNPVGEPITTSCRTRLSEFTSASSSEAGSHDVSELCTQFCQHESIAFAPTTTHVDGVPSIRPWLEFRYGSNNLSDPSVPTHEAFACIGQAGISGCDYEAPLDALTRVMEAAHDPSSPWYGFIRPEAQFHAVIVSDEDDCSTRDASVLDPDGDRVFWPADAQGSRAPSAACFRAGSACTDTGEAYECVAVDRQADVDLAGAEPAVLLPLASVQQLFDELRESKIGNGTPREVSLALIGGVGDSGPPTWPLGGDAAFVSEYGIGPGCEEDVPDASASPRAIAPPRLYELAESVTPDNAFTVCGQDYSPSLESVGTWTGPGPPPKCFNHCVADRDPSTPLLEPECTLVAHYNSITESIPECAKDDGGYVIDPETNDYSMPGDAEHCYAFMVDESGDESPDPYDNLTQECVDAGAPLELKVAVRPGAAIVPLARRYELACVEDLTPGACDTATP